MQGDGEKDDGDHEALVRSLCLTQTYLILPSLALAWAGSCGWCGPGVGEEGELFILIPLGHFPPVRLLFWEPRRAGVWLN